uniref:Uncharacterized protein n=1 Tax=Strongyloides venezuelensis TaxID=75913 RepID=A0A0K0FWL5_STRVS
MISLLIRPINSQGVPRWFQPKYIGDFMEETKVPKCEKYYNPMVRYDDKLITFKGEIEWVPARREDFLPCPCNTTVQGFVSQGSRWLTFTHVDVQINGEELRFNHHIVNAEYYEKLVLDHIIISENTLRADRRTTSAFENNKNSNLPDATPQGTAESTLQNLGSIYRGMVENTNSDGNIPARNPQHPSSLGIIYQPPQPSLTSRSNAPSPPSRQVVSNNTHLSPPETPKTSRAGRVHFPTFSEIEKNTGDQAFISASDRTLGVIAQQRDNNSQGNYDRFRPLIASTAVRSRKEREEEKLDTEKKLAEKREIAFRKNVERITSLANNLDNHYNLEFFRQEIEDAIHNLNGMDAAKMFTVTLMAFLEIYLKEKGWKTVMTNIVSRIRKTRNGGSILLPETTTHTK